MALFCRSTPDDENATVSSDDQLCTEGVCRDLFLDWSDETARLMFGRCVGSPPPHEGLPPSQLPYATRLALSAPGAGHGLHRVSHSPLAPLAASRSAVGSTLIISRPGSAA